MASRVGADRPRMPNGSCFKGERGSWACSRTSTERPARRSSQARNRPTGPAPAMTTSWHSLGEEEDGGRSCMKCSCAVVRPEQFRTENPTDEHIDACAAPAVHRGEL